MSHKCLLAILSLTGVLLASCAAMPTAVVPPPAPTATAQPEQLLQPQVLSSPTAALPSATEALTSTPEPFALNLTPLPTETPLPTLEIPTVAPRAPVLEAWDGLPTYLADSAPGYYFRVLFDPDAWALTTDYYGAPALVHRAIRNCIIAPTAGHGLPPNATVSQEVRRIDAISYQISTISLNEVRQSVTYTGGDGRILTAFQVTLDERPDQCLQEAELVLGTLTSLRISEATPIATP
jgi:hypothetical protein